MRLLTTTALLALAAGTVLAQKIASQAVDPEIVPSRDLLFEQRLDSQLPMDAKFVDQAGNTVTLGETFRGRPVILGLVYYKCPSLCNLVLNGLLASLKIINFSAGNEFDVVMVGIDEREKPITANAKLVSYLNQYDREGAEKGWHFLTGEQPEIKRVAKAVGYSYKFDIRRDQYAHPAGIVVITPEGRVSKYFLGIEYAARDLKFAVMDASEEKIGSVVEQAVAYCFQWDPHSGKYSLAVMRILQVGGLLTVLCIVSLVAYLVKHNPTIEPEGEPK
ncbi:MAG: SCO family protein [Armatimonadota bacterium]|nr:SCO family protein [Armatimonadota bacterium]